jgi:hypothetical protein
MSSSNRPPSPPTSEMFRRMVEEEKTETEMQEDIADLRASRAQADFLVATLEVARDEGQDPTRWKGMDLRIKRAKAAAKLRKTQIELYLCKRLPTFLQSLLWTSRRQRRYSDSCGLCRGEHLGSMEGRFWSGDSSKTAGGCRSQGWKHHLLIPRLRLWVKGMVDNGYWGTRGGLFQRRTRWGAGENSRGPPSRILACPSLTQRIYPR